MTYPVTFDDDNESPVSTDPALLWTAKPPPSRQPTAGAFLWLLVKNGRRLMCELRDHGDYGVEVQLLVNEELLAGYGHPTRASAERWADAYRGEREAEGWGADNEAT